MDLRLIAPELTVLLGAILLLLLDLIVRNKKIIAGLGLLVLLLALLQAGSLFGTRASLFSSMIVVDPFAVFFKALALLVCALTILVSLNYRALPRRSEGEYYAILLFACLGLMLLAAASNLVSVYVALELTSLACYVLAGFLKDQPR